MPGPRVCIPDPEEVMVDMAQLVSSNKLVRL
jgi:hypothetical protein